MGSGKWDPGTYDTYSTTASTRSVHDNFRMGFNTVRDTGRVHESLDPLKVKNRIRESRDSADNPRSTPVIVALDQTGSMGILAQAMAVKGLGAFFDAVLDRKPITDPHMMFMAIGDAYCDQHPLQVSQFEADARIIEQLSTIFLEGNGGGNSFESYDLAWYFAANHTAIDSFEKRGERGFLFTVGDENFPAQGLNSDQLARFVGDRDAEAWKAEQSLAAAQLKYHCFHIIVAEGSYARRALPTVTEGWRKRLGQNVIVLEDHTKMSEVIISTMQIVKGEDPDSVAKSWGGSTDVVVSEAVRNLQVMKGWNPRT